MSPDQQSQEQVEPHQAGSESADSTARPEVRRRKPALDQTLAQATDFALAALKQVVPAQEIGDGHRVAADDDRLVTHYFTSTKRGYRQWEWYVSIARAPRQTEPTVCETGILPSGDALLAPEWVPWSERLSDEEKETDNDDASESAELTPDQMENSEDSDSAQNAEQTDSADQRGEVLHPDVVADLDDQGSDHNQKGDADESVAPGNSHA